MGHAGYPRNASKDLHYWEGRKQNKKIRIVIHNIVIHLTGDGNHDMTSYNIVVSELKNT